VAIDESVSGSTAPVVFFQVVTLSNGKVVLSPALDSFDPVKPPFYLWDPAADSFALFGPVVITSQPLGISRSADHSKLIATGALDGGLLYDVNSNSFTGPASQISGVAALNSDGSRIASTTFQNSMPVFAFYDSKFDLLDTLPFNAFSSSGPSPQLFYSLDGKVIYIVPDQSIAVGIIPGGAVTVVDAKTFSVLGLVPAFSFGTALPFSGQSITTFAVDETGMLFGAGNGGVGFLDLSSPTALTEPLPGSFLVQPGLLSLTSPTQTQLDGTGFSQEKQVNLFVGPPPSSPQSIKATNLSVQSSNFVNLTIPAGNAAGPANATLTRTDGFFEVIPDAVTFGPTIVRVDADAGSPAGGDSVKIVGYGFDSPNTQVLISGKAAAISQTTGAISGTTFPTERITITTPAGSAGLADVTVNTPSGSTTSPRAFQYVSSVQVFPTVGALDAITYDSSRKRLYVSNQDHNRVEIFDLTTNQFLSPVTVGNAPTSIALTPDAQLLAVINSGDGTASLIDPVKLQVMTTYQLLTAADRDKVGCGGVVTQISPVAPHKMIISVNCVALLDAGVAHLIDLDTGSLSCNGTIGCDSGGTNLNVGLGAPVTASNRDGTKVFFTANDVGVLDLKANTLTINGAGIFSDSAADALGDVFAADFGTYDTQAVRISIMAFEPYADSGSQSFHNVVGEKLNPSGSLLFFPQDSGVDIFDVHTGRLMLHLVLPDPIPLDTNAMVLDETGTKLFLISSTGITVAQLFQSPLSLATVNPAAAVPGTSLTLRGSGFQNGVVVTFGTTQVQVTFLDPNTLQVMAPGLPAGPVRVTIKNPDGSKYSLDDAFTIN
jgi:DNA-binding beta-propeller fold protein YncE